MTEDLRPVRSIVLGAIIGSVFAAANVYTGLKVAFIDGGAIAASLLAFAVFRFTRGRIGTLRGATNLAQVTASAAASAVGIVGLAGPLPALHLTGLTIPTWAGILWGCLLGWFGIWAAFTLRGLLLDRARLPFPTGEATAGVIQSMDGGEEGPTHARLLVLLAVGVGVFTWLRDGPWHAVPSLWELPVTVAGVAAGALGIGVSLSPLIAGTGGLVGRHVAASMVVGGALAWFGVIPRLAERRIVEPTFQGATEWLVWPAVALLLSGVLTSFVDDARKSGQIVRDGRAVWRELAAQSGMLWIGGALAAGIVVCGFFALGVHPLVTSAALGLALVFSLVCGRAAGETDVAPVGTAGTMTQLAVATAGIRSCLLGGAVAAGTAAGAAQGLWSLKASAVLGVARRPVAIAQIVGVLVGTCVAFPTFDLVVEAYGLGTQAMPAWGAQSWRATAEAVTRGDAMPPFALQAFGLAALAGVGLHLLARRRPWAPLSPIGVGIGLLVPLSFSITMLAGAVVLHRAFGRRALTLAVVAGAGIAGESLTAVALAFFG